MKSLQNMNLSGNMHSFWEGVLISTQIPVSKISFANTGLNAFRLIKKANIQNTTNAQQGKTERIIPSTPNQTRNKQLTNINYYLEWHIYSLFFIHGLATYHSMPQFSHL